MTETATAEEIKAPEVEKEAETTRPPGIAQNRFGPIGEFANVWRVNAPMNVKPEDTLNEQFWEHISMLLKPGDEIHVMPDNMAWEQVLHVVNAGKLYAHVIQKELYHLKPTTEGQHLPSIYKVEFVGSHHKWRVVRAGSPLKDGFESESLARRYAANHEAAVTR